MLLRVQGYDLRNQYIPGNCMMIADTLSRAAVRKKKVYSLEATDSLSSEMLKQAVQQVKGKIAQILISAT